MIAEMVKARGCRRPTSGSHAWEDFLFSGWSLGSQTGRINRLIYNLAHPFKGIGKPERRVVGILVALTDDVNHRWCIERRRRVTIQRPRTTNIVPEYSPAAFKLPRLSALRSPDVFNPLNSSAHVA